DRNRSHWSTSKTPSYTKSVSWQHHPPAKESNFRIMIIFYRQYSAAGSIHAINTKIKGHSSHFYAYCRFG
ncbi:hypothetical protein ACUNG4_13570, partial [Serratia sp. IR-2025]